MAILGATPGLSVSICVDNEPLPEYEDDEEVVAEKPGAVGEYQVSRTVSKYIEAISDKEFTIKIVIDQNFRLDCPTLQSPVTIDGRLELIPLILKESLEYTGLRGALLRRQHARIVDGSYVAAPGKPKEQFLKPFKFCKIETTQDDAKLKDVNEDSKVISKVGEIEIKIYRTSESKIAAGIVAPDVSTSVKSKVHEKALKGAAKSHSVSFGAATKLVPKSYYTVEKLDGDDYPIAIFKFKYRSREALKSLLIIDRTPSPEPGRESVSPPPVDFNNLPADQKRQLARVLNDINRGRSSSSTQRTIKREREEGNDGGVGSSRKRSKLGKKITIDLTGDSDEENIIPLN